MLYRRNARIKVMQALYGYLQDIDIPKEILQKQLRKRFDQAYDLYLFCLLSVKDVCEFAEKYADIKASQMLATEEEKQTSTRLAESSFVAFLDETETFKKPVRKKKLTTLLDEELTRMLFYELKDKPLYQSYTDNGSEQSVSDVEMLQYLFDELMANNEDFEAHLESNFPVWFDDKEIICFAVRDTISGVGAHSFKKHDEFVNKLDEAYDFSRELLDKSIDHNEEYKELISPKLKNWDIDRIALMDLLLMRMALTEILNFSTIPIKVSMNEYIDISKEYSTPKSKEFINGVLDKITKELDKENRIYKEGRGLINK